MASDRQIAANRLNAQNSTGPRTADGKRRSRRNAVRHGLTAETVIDVLEDAKDYKALEVAINADYHPRTAFELELVARLVSLLWRLRRAVAIESGLLDIQAEYLRKHDAAKRDQLDKDKLSVFYSLVPALTPASQIGIYEGNAELNNKTGLVDVGNSSENKFVRRNLARSYSRLANREGGTFDRLGRYERSLWRQTVQVILLLNSINSGAKLSFEHDNKCFELTNATKRRRQILWPPFIHSR